MTYDELNEILFANFSNNNYNINYNNNYNLSYNENNNISNLNEENENSYYGMKTMTNVKKAYRYNLVGLKMIGKIVSEIQTSTGKGKTYFDKIYGSKHIKIKM